MHERLPVRPRDFVIFILICLVWGFSNVLSKIVIDHWSVPPLFFAALRFSLVALVTLPWLLPMPRPRLRVAAIGLLLGAGNFALLFLGLQSASPSAVAIVIQIGVPFTTLLSIFILGERIRWRRGLGIALTLLGVLIVLWSPQGIELSAGLWFVIGAALAGSLGAVLMKRTENVAPLRFQAWVGLVSFLPLACASAFWEQGQWAAAAEAGWRFAAALLFSAIVVSVVAHSAYFWMISRYEANLVAPLTLLTPLSTIGFGVLLTGDDINLRMVAGAVLAFIGVLIVALRTRKPEPLP